MKRSVQPTSSSPWRGERERSTLRFLRRRDQRILFAFAIGSSEYSNPSRTPSADITTVSGFTRRTICSSTSAA